MASIRKDMTMNNDDEKALKRSAYCANSENFTASLQIEQLKINDFWDKAQWMPILEIYVMEFFLTYNGYDFSPSRRNYQYQHLENKEFFKDLVQLPVYKS